VTGTIAVDQPSAYTSSGPVFDAAAVAGELMLQPPSALSATPNRRYGRSEAAERHSRSGAPSLSWSPTETRSRSSHAADAILVMVRKVAPVYPSKAHSSPLVPVVNRSARPSAS
jgi:hypothetical protein